MTSPMSPTSIEPLADRIEADVMALASMRDPDRPGWSRQVFSEPYRASRAWVRERMREVGLEVTQDGAGNIVGVLPGSSPGAPPLVTGSHTDTVDGGGRFDGMVGVLGALELVRCLQESNTRLTRDLIVVDFLGEESNDWGLSCLGSRSLAGELTTDHLRRTDTSGTALGDRYHQFGISPEQAMSADWFRRNRPHAYVELHIEQGPLLENTSAQIGVVTAIAGIQRLLATFTGRSDHAGTRPMDDRADAMVAAAQAVLDVQRTGCGAPTHGVATTTSLTTGSVSPNVVPAAVEMKTEVRSIDASWLSLAQEQLVRDIAAHAQREGVDVEFEWTNDNEIVQTSTTVQDSIARVAAAAGHSWQAVPSGATHDAVHMARLAPMGMIFVPSRDGRSHCPEEWTDFSDVIAGVQVLGSTLLDLDRATETSVSP